MQAATHLAQLVHAAELRQAELEARIAVLTAQEAELTLRWRRVADYVADVELQSLLAADPIAAPYPVDHR